MFHLMESRGFVVGVNRNGLSTYSPGGEIAVFCSLDLSLFPFDQHNCSLFFEPWSHPYEVQHYKFTNKSFVILRFKENEQWDLIGWTNFIFILYYSNFYSPFPTGTDQRLRNNTYEDEYVYHQVFLNDSKMTKVTCYY